MGKGGRTIARTGEIQLAMEDGGDAVRCPSSEFDFGDIRTPCGIPLIGSKHAEIVPEYSNSEVSSYAPTSSLFSPAKGYQHNPLPPGTPENRRCERIRITGLTQH